LGGFEKAHCKRIPGPFCCEKPRLEQKDRAGGGTERRIYRTRFDKASRVCIPSAENHEMGHDSIERIVRGIVTKYIDNDHRDPRAKR
jgi:hypothetical protein